MAIITSANRWKAGICRANGIDVHYLRTGGEKPPLILLHGLMTSGACLAPVARELEEDYDVIMPDARGHGKSSAPDHGYNYDNLAFDVWNFMEALQLANPILLGHSMGGMVATVIASQHPRQLGGLILVDSTFLTLKRQWEVYESDLAAQHLQTLTRPWEDFLAEMRMRRKQRPSELIELLAQARFQTSIHAFEILKPPNPNYMQLINALDIRSLLVIGGVNAIVSSEVAAKFAQINQRLEVVQIAEAGHGIPYDQPERLATAVKDYACSVVSYKK